MSRPILIGCAVVFASAFAWGCNTIAGIHDPVDSAPGSSSGTVPPGDGGTDDATGATGLDRFVGTWVSTGGTQAFTNCTAARSVSSVAATLIVTKGSADTILVTPKDAPDCHIGLTVSGDVASVLPGESCVFTLDSETDTYAYIAPTTFNLTAGNPTEANVSITANVEAQPQAVSCTFEERSVYMKQ